MPFPPIVEELSPAYVGEDRITLQLDASTQSPRANSSVVVLIDYSPAAPAGVVLPLELLIQAPSAGNVVRKVFRRIAPITITFTPREGGLHGVLLRELGHNRWQGRLRVQVAGDPTTPQTPG